MGRMGLMGFMRVREPCADAQGTVASGVWVSLLWGLGFLAVEVAGASVKKIFFGMW